MTRDEIIKGLRELANLLESKTEFPLPWPLGADAKPIGLASRRLWSLDDLRDTATQLGSFKKRYNDDYFELVVTLPSGLELVYYTDRERVCKKTVTYDCQDADSILLGISGGKEKS